jgi:hypothetical protein
MQEQNNPSENYLIKDYPHLLSSLTRTFQECKEKIIKSDYVPSLQTSDTFTKDPWYSLKIQEAKGCLAAAKELVNLIKVTYKDLLFARNKRPVPNWITNQKAIEKALKKTKFADVYGYITEKTLSYNKAIEFAKEHNIENFKKTGKNGEQIGAADGYMHVFFSPDYPDMQNELDLSEKSIQKYLKRFCEIGILVKLRKTDARGNNIYSAGYHALYKNDEGKIQTRRILFLKNTPEMKEALRNFNLRGQKVKSQI